MVYPDIAVVMDDSTRSRRGTYPTLETPGAVGRIGFMPLHNDRRRLAFAFILLLAIVAVGALSLVATANFSESKSGMSKRFS